MRNLSRLVRKVADPEFWLREVDVTAAANGCWDEAEIERAKTDVCCSINELSILAFDFRHTPQLLESPLRDWLGDQDAALRSRLIALMACEDEDDPISASDQVAMIVKRRFLDRLFNVVTNCLNPQATMTSFDKPNSFNEAASHVRKALDRIRSAEGPPNSPEVRRLEEKLQEALRLLDAVAWDKAA